MTRQKFRLPVGGLIDRLQPVEFRFDGKSLEGYVGDTLASALLANGVRLVGRTFHAFNRNQTERKAPGGPYKKHEYK